MNENKSCEVAFEFNMWRLGAANEMLSEREEKHVEDLLLIAGIELIEFSVGWMR